MPDSHEYIASLEDVKIGKNVLETLTRSAYDDCRCIFREYVQNAADQIDIAKEIHLSDEEEYAIYVKIDAQDRRIEIEDNATGVQEKDIYPILRNVACSRKDRKTRKGFRGIGRLGGLGYCSTLTFVTSYKGESVKSILKWNASEMTRMIDDENDESSASAVVSAVTELNKEKEDVNKHYFRVILEDVKDNLLLNVDNIHDYLSMVAPVEISNTFQPFKNKIKQFMDDNQLSLDTYNVYVNGDQIFKPYTKTIYDKNKVEKDTVENVECYIREDSEGRPFYWGWYSICKLDGQIDFINLAHGIRLRCKNIQLGDETNCRRFLPNKQDQRFNDYFFGEIHTISEHLIPDTDRNYIRVDEARNEFEEKVSNDFSRLKDLCYQASGYRSDYKKIVSAEQKRQNIEEKKKNRKYTSEEQQEKEEKDYQKSVEEAKKSIASMNKRKKQLETEKSPIASLMSSAYDITNINNSEHNPSSRSKPDELDFNYGSEVTEVNDSQPQSFLRTSKPIYDKYTGQTREVINLIYKTIGDVLPIEEMREALISKIEEVLTK